MRAHPILALMILCSCAADGEPIASVPDEAAPVAAQPFADDALARLELEPGHTIAFYATEAGALSVVEVTALAQQPLEIAIPSIEGIYAAARPTEALPANLRDAVARSRELAAHSAPVLDNASERGGGAAARLRTSSNADGFINSSHYCDAPIISGYPNITSVCRVNWSGGFFSYVSGWNTGFMYTSAEALVGSVTLRAQAGGSIRDTNVSQGSRVRSWNFGNPPGLLLRTDVLNAASSSFHVGVIYMQCPQANGQNVC